MVRYEDLMMFDDVVVKTKKAIIIGKIYNVTKVQEMASMEKLLAEKITFESLGITLKDSEGNYRNFGDILSEIQGRWDSFLLREQKQIQNVFQKETYKTTYILQISATEHSAIRLTSDDIVSIERYSG